MFILGESHAPCHLTPGEPVSSLDFSFSVSWERQDYGS